MSKEMIDVEKMRQKQKQTGLPFLKIKEPEGKVFFAYRLQFLEEPRSQESKRWTDPITGKPKIDTRANVTLLETVNDEEQEIKGKTLKLEKGSKWCVNISPNLMRELESFKPLKDKTFDIMNRGKPKGKTYFDYVALPQEGTLRHSMLARLFIK